MGDGERSASGLLGVLITVAFVWSARRNAQQLAAAATTLDGEREQLRVTLASIGDGVIVTDPVGQREHAQLRGRAAHRLVPD